MQVKVWNDNVHPYSEKFQDQDIHIAPGKFIEMDYEKARNFLGTFAPIKVDGDGNPIAEGFKKLRIEKPTDAVFEAPKVTPNVCIVCKYEGASEKDLSEHAKAAHAAQAVKDEAIEKELAARPKKKAG